MRLAGLTEDGLYTATAAGQLLDPGSIPGGSTRQPEGVNDDDQRA